MRTRLVTGPVAEPITLAEAKLQCRIDGDDEDAVVLGLITSVRLACEQIARRVFLTQTWDLTLDAWPCSNVIDLPYPPLQSVASITYIDSDNVTHTMSTSDYFVDIDADPGRVCLAYGKAWPSVTLRPQAAIKIRFVAGWDNVENVPAIYRQAMLLEISNLYENRGDAEVQMRGATSDLLMMDRGSW